MKKYAIGLCALDQDIEVVIIEAENKLSAMHIAIKNKFNWDVEEDGRLPYVTSDDAIDYFLQGDINISKPVEI